MVPLLLLAAPVSAAQDDLLLTGAGPAAVEVVLRGSASLDPAAMTFRTTGQVAGLAVLDARGEVVLVTVNARRWVDGAVIAVLHQRSTVSLASLPEVCLAEPGAPDCPVAAAASSAVVGPVVGDGFTRLAVFLYGDQGAAPRYDLLARAPAVGVVRATDALLITL